MKVLVTGGNGCVGSALKSQCANEDNWIFIGREDCNLVHRYQTIDLFQDIKPDYVIHLASYVPGFYNIDKVSSFSTNVKINENVLEASHLSGVERGMFCLSVNMFASARHDVALNESMIFDGNLSGAFAGYAYSKRMLAMQCENYNQQYNRKYFGIIPSNIYGPNDNLTSGRLVPSLICKFKDAIKNDTDVIINGTGKPVRQFLYSIDLAKIIKHLTYNYNDVKPVICCSDVQVSISELAYEISRLMKFQGQVKFDLTKPDGTFKNTVDNSYLKSIIPNFSFTPLKLGLENTINQMRDV